MSANETAREWLKAHHRDILQRLMFSNDLGGEDLAMLLAAYHSSQMSGIAQRAAEKIAREFLQPLKFSSQAYEFGIASWAKYIAAIIEEEGR